NKLYAHERTAEITRKRIETIFQVGLLHEHDSLLLGGLGCGAFNNPQMRIIEYFNEMIEKYGPYFKQITFAILSKKDPNYDLFSEHIRTSLKPLTNNNNTNDNSKPQESDTTTKEEEKGEG